MSNRLPVPAGHFASTPIRRAAARYAAETELSTWLATSAIAAETVRARARVESVVDVTEAAMLGASHISAVEGCLIGVTPLAEPRLRAIADAGCVGLQSIVLRHARVQ